FYEQPDVWFGVLRFISEGLLITLAGFCVVNQLAKRLRLPQFNLQTYTAPAIWVLVMLSVNSVLIDIMSLSSDVISNALSLPKSTILQNPFKLALVAVIVLLILFSIKNTVSGWYILAPILILIALSMSGHAWSQTVPKWTTI